MEIQFQNINDRINKNRSRFTLIENNIANYIQDNLEQASNLTISNLSKVIGVSEASINRFSKKIGFKGYNDFKIALAQDSHYIQIQETKVLKTEASFSDSLAFDYIDIIKLTSKSLNKEKLDEIKKIIIKSKKIYLISFGEFQFFSQYLQYQLLLLGIDSTIINQTNLFKLVSHKSSENDLFIVLNDYIDGTEINNNLETIIQNQSMIINIISSNSKKAIKNQYDIIVPTNLIINKNSIGTAKVAFFFVIDTIIGYMIKTDPSLKKEKLINDGIFSSINYLENY